MITTLTDEMILEKVKQLPVNLQLETIHYIDYLLFITKNQNTENAKTNSFEKYYGFVENFWNIDAQEYVNQLRDEERF